MLAVIFKLSLPIIILMLIACNDAGQDANTSKPDIIIWA
jgi:hypothetical protein